MHLSIVYYTQHGCLTRFADHPTVKAVRAPAPQWNQRMASTPIGCGNCAWRPAPTTSRSPPSTIRIGLRREHVEAALPGTRSYISLVVRMNRDNVRSTARSVANQEFHRSGEIINEAAHRITRALQDAGHRALNPSATFPMEMDRYPAASGWVAHKPVAVASGSA